MYFLALPLRLNVQHFVLAVLCETFDVAAQDGGDAIPNQGLLNDLGREESGAPSWQEDMFAAWDRVWMRWFHDAPISRRKQLRIERYAISVLSGLASSQMLEGAGAAGGPPELARLVDTLTRELSCAD